MAFSRFQDFLDGLVKTQRSLFFPLGSGGSTSINDLLEKLMANTGEVSAIVTARELLDTYQGFDESQRLAFFQHLEQNFNADVAGVRESFLAYDEEPNSATLNALSVAAEPRRLELLRRLNQTSGAASDLVIMRQHLLHFLRSNSELKAVDDDFMRMFSSWFGRGFLQLRSIDWSTSAAVLERLIRYEAVHQIKDLEDLRSRIEPVNRRCFGFFHPALVDEPLIFVQVALSRQIPSSITNILANPDSDVAVEAEFDTATFYSISNCQPGLKNISFGNFLIKQVVQELQGQYPTIKNFVTLSPIPGFSNWLSKESAWTSANEKARNLRLELTEFGEDEIGSERARIVIRKLVILYLLHAKKGRYPADPVARFHLGNGARVHQVHAGADTSAKGVSQSRGAMVNYFYDRASIEKNHEGYVTEGRVYHNEKLDSLISGLKINGVK